LACELGVISWLIYGNVLSYSKASDGCTASNPVLSYLMLLVLIIGYLQFLIYATVILFVVGVVFLRYRQRR
jgi:hypothetical protein